MATEPDSGSDIAADKARSSAHTEEAEAGFPATWTAKPGPGRLDGLAGEDTC